MAWDFRTEPEFEEKLEWIGWFRAERVEPLDLLCPGRAFHPLDDETGPVVRALKQQVRDQDCGPRTSVPGWADEASGRSGWR
jgi:acyl-CoA dehydrogenase